MGLGLVLNQTFIVMGFTMRKKTIPEFREVSYFYQQATAAAFVVFNRQQAGNSSKQEEEEGREEIFREKAKMEKVRKALELTKEETELVSRLNVPPHRVGTGKSFYEDFALRGIRVDRVESGLVSCTFKVPPRLTGSSGKLSTGAIANLVDEVGGAVVHVEGLPMKVSVDMSISYLSTAKVDDELEITSRVLGQKGGYSGTIVQLKNKVTGELIAEGRHSLFGRLPSKI